MAAPASRSIPACAGEPPPHTRWRPAGWVYPRVCGGTAGQFGVRRAGNGLSPRVRGNPDARPAGGYPLGSIPACAGEPSRWTGIRRRGRVYPRVCGGTDKIPLAHHLDKGLSPRVRGNPPRTMKELISRRSIPACAGEPQPDVGRRQCHPVYPRVCGGTPRTLRTAPCCPGLSPRVRGNPPWPIADPNSTGSIPACAGEPPVRRQAWVFQRVYPRVCGGTYGRQRARCSNRGLSPRVRGTSPAAQLRSSGNGLSPRVRGNPRTTCMCTGATRSIPACAGEPRR